MESKTTNEDEQIQLHSRLHLHYKNKKIKCHPQLTLLLVTLARDVIPEWEGEAAVEGEGDAGGAASVLRGLVVDEVYGAQVEGCQAHLGGLRGWFCLFKRWSEKKVSQICHSLILDNLWDRILSCLDVKYIKVICWVIGYRSILKVCHGNVSFVCCRGNWKDVKC